MPIFEFEGKRPTIADGVFVAPTASVIGDVTLEAGASVWYGAVLRGDDGPIIVRRGANVQDNAVLHSPVGGTTDIGPGVTIAHGCVVHGAIIEEEALIANGTIVLDYARVGAGSLVAAHSLVAAYAVIPPGVLAVGTPAVVKRELAGTHAEKWVKGNPAYYPVLAQRHLRAVRQLD